MTYLIRNIAIAVAAAFMVATSACSDNKSYAELLSEENMAVNRFLADQRVVGEVPADNKFEVGEHAPYYQLDEDGNLYMQVISLGDDGMVTDGQLIYFRFMRYALASYVSGETMTGEGNSDYVESGNMSFRYGNFTLQSSSQWGTGIQKPLEYLPVGSEVRIVIKSQEGWTSELAYVQPYLYHVRYYPSQI